MIDQLGEDLPDGAASSALYDIGDRRAVGAPGRDGSDDVGVVRVYEWNGTGWAQLGADLQGEEPGDLFGSALHLSSDGNRLAVGAWRNQGVSDAAWCTPTCEDGGQVRVFEWDGSAWAQLGSDIDGDTDSYYSGSNVELSSDGTRVVVAGWNQVRIFDFQGGDWVQAGSYLPGGERGIAISADGRRVAVGPTGGVGLVVVYDWNGSDWVPAGEPLEGDDDFVNCCGSPTMSADGNRVTIAPGFPQVTLSFEWDGNNWVRVTPPATSTSATSTSTTSTSTASTAGTLGHPGLVYEQIGEDIEVGPWSRFGPRVTLSDDGQRLAVGSPGNNDGESVDFGVVRVYAWTGTGWEQIGADLIGEVAGDEFGATLSLSSDGTRLAVGAQAYSDDPLEAPDGYVRAFEWDGSAWNQLGDDIEGLDWSGYHVELSADGILLAVGSWSYVRVFDSDGVAWVQVGDDILHDEGGVAMSANGLRVAIGSPITDGFVRIYDWDGSVWALTGEIDGSAFDLDQFGGQVISLSAGGNRLTASGGRATRDGQGGLVFEGDVTLSFEWDGSSWIHAGEEVPGWGCAMSADGNRLATCSGYASALDSLRIFDWDGSNWIEAPALPSGDHPPALSANGAIVAVGVAGDIVRVFSIAEAPPTTTIVAKSTTSTALLETTSGPRATLPPTGPSLLPTGLTLAVAMIAAGAVALTVRRRPTTSE